MHEQSETIQLPDGKWANVYGRKTKKAGQRLPGTPEYNTLEEDERAARKRSKDYENETPSETITGQPKY
jgi:hypothetical protein